jgi:hypothetical protein
VAWVLWHELRRTRGLAAGLLSRTGLLTGWLLAGWLLTGWLLTGWLLAGWLLTRPDPREGPAGGGIGRHAGPGHGAAEPGAADDWHTGGWR